jgi:hypothetical protein
MRRIFIAALCAFFPIAAVAQNPPPGYTEFDRAQQAKLLADLGSWQCVSTPASTTPRTFIETEEGNWFVTRENGDNPATTYEHWSHTLKAYVLVAIFDSGASNVAQTMSLDPDNATWTQMWPALDNQGRKRFDNQVSRKEDTIRSTSQFFDENGNVRTTTTACTKA